MLASEDMSACERLSNPSAFPLCNYVQASTRLVCVGEHEPLLSTPCSNSGINLCYLVVPWEYHQFRNHYDDPYAGTCILIARRSTVVMKTVSCRAGAGDIQQ
jgi:hypothetical protein